MAENKTPKAPKKETKSAEREYVIPLRSAWLRVPRYERTKRAVKAIKMFVARHMKVENRDLNKVKLDVSFNNDIWFRGRAHPPGKVKVKVKKEGELVQVTFLETPKHVAFETTKRDKLHKKPEEKKAAAPAKPATSEAPKQEKSEEEKKEEKEKEKSVAEAAIKQADASAKTQKHTATKTAPKIQRKAMKK